MTDRAQFEAMLEALINEDQETAKEIFHNIVVGKSREIYEELLESDFGQDQGNPYAKNESSEEEEEESTNPFASKEEGEEEGEEEEEEGEEEEDGNADDSEEDPFADSEEDSDPEEGGGDVEDRVMDLEDALEDLKAEFEMLLKGEQEEEENEPGIHGEGEPMHDLAAQVHGDDDGGADVGGPDELAGLMEYVNKIGAPYSSGANIAGTKEGQHVGAQAGSVTSAMNVKSTIDNMKNDMGGTTANIAQNHVEVHGDAGVKAGGTKGGLLAPSTKPLIGKVQNTPGVDAGKTGFKTRVKGGGIDAQSGFDQPGKQVGAKDSSGRGESNTKSLISKRVR